MVRPQRYAIRAESPDRSNRAWIEALRADIKHIHDLRWELIDRVATHDLTKHPAGREQGSEITRIRTEAHHQLDEFEQDIYDSLDPHLTKSEQDLVERGLLEDGTTTNNDPPGDVLAKEWNDLKRLRQAKLRAIDLTRQVLRYETDGDRARSRVWTRVTGAVMRWVFVTGFWVFFAGLWFWVHVLRRDKYRY